MPELPEVETVRLGLTPALVGRRIIKVDQRRPDLRFPFPKDFARRLTGRRVERLDRRAKYILVHLDDGEVLVIHLGMTGRFTVRRDGALSTPGTFEHEAPTDTAHEHLVLKLDDGARVAYADARRFGYMTLVSETELPAHKLFRHLGLEPLGGGLSAAALAEALKGKKASIKAALMDQRMIAGLGNIYVCEALHRAGLSPKKLAGSLVMPGGRPRAALDRLIAAIRAVLLEAIRAGGSTLRDFQNAEGGSGLFQHDFAVYGREGERCVRPGCRGTIRRIVQGARSTFYCPTCQR